LYRRAWDESVPYISASTMTCQGNPHFPALLYHKSITFQGKIDSTLRTILLYPVPVPVPRKIGPDSKRDFCFWGWSCGLVGVEGFGSMRRWDGVWFKQDVHELPLREIRSF
jgi:hypothetical protein